MRETFESLLIFMFLSFPATAHTTDDCRADVRHLKLPEHAFIDDVLGLAQPPLVFLFSQDGVDVYSATHLKAMQVFQKSGMPLANAFTAGGAEVLVKEGRGGPSLRAGGAENKSRERFWVAHPLGFGSSKGAGLEESG